MIASLAALVMISHSPFPIFHSFILRRSCIPYWILFAFVVIFDFAFINFDFPESDSHTP